MSDGFTGLDATAQAELVRRGEAAPIELVEAAITRIERLNPILNAVTIPLFDRAREQALSPSLPDGPFRGVPLLLKDFFCHTAGDPYYEGTRFLQERDWREEHDTYLAARFRATGISNSREERTETMSMRSMNSWQSARYPSEYSIAPTTTSKSERSIV